jgi:hypothetical protein
MKMIVLKDDELAILRAVCAECQKIGEAYLAEVGPLLTPANRIAMMARHNAMLEIQRKLK